ncbi:MAG: hypothetical protein ABIA75_01450 [Candidatus Neomarinimicrobiota bacterium]
MLRKSRTMFSAFLTVLCIVGVGILLLAFGNSGPPYVDAPIPDALIMDDAWAVEFETVTATQSMLTKMVTQETMYDLLASWPAGEAIPLRVKTDWLTGEQVVAFLGGDLAYREKIAGCPPNCYDVPTVTELTLSSVQGDFWSKTTVWLQRHARAGG